ncbi:unnamed protein product [Tilletia controversa]|uniref:C2H2-type domain-containing protein n=3 Tax=Tilletia TaxID=13289 RepID=A0A8X7T028_9BASI|nr:hypothetical protein CF336_g1555 [Tilletia laevis]KAE8205115.1 hypothetical protein CF328_g682 [Tilletia controversa]KAE8264312.1 hypothetical protein A4X03_0g1036 [Tilletia caries]KAE8207711.1 hypothetical protein CF335_g949 [Tilletia laevis]KAE8254076.1 hypothetical protein A4X06_0g1074 [Tilletia controversa]
MQAVNPFASLFPPLQSGIASPASASSTINSASNSNVNRKGSIDWAAHFTQPSTRAVTAETQVVPVSNTNPNFTAGFFAASPEGLSAGSPASSRDFGSPLLDFELPFAAENEAALFPPAQSNEVADWMAKFNLANSDAFPPSNASNAPVQTTQAQIDMANVLRSVALLTAQHHSSQQSASTSAETFSQAMSIPEPSSSQQQDRAVAEALANSTSDLAASQVSMLSQTSSEDDFMPIRAPVHLPSNVAASSHTSATWTTSYTAPDFMNPLNNMQTSWTNPFASMADSIGGLSQQSIATVEGSQHSSRDGSPGPAQSPRASIHNLATDFVREYARSHAVHDTDVLVRGLRTAGIQISDEVLREIVGPSPLSLGSPASQMGSSSASVSPQLNTTLATSMSAMNCNANFAMLMSGLGMAGQTQTDEVHSFSQSSSLSSLSSVPEIANVEIPTFDNQQSQSYMAQSQSDDGWSSDVSWSPPPTSVTRKVKVTQPTASSSRARSSVSAQHSDAKTEILGSTTNATSANSHLPGGSSSDGIMTTIWLPSGKRAFQCNVCQKQFDRAFNLRTHADTHKSVAEREKGKRFICPYNKGEADECGKPFARKHDCIRHWKTVHGKAVSGASSAAAINKLKAPEPFIKDSDHEASSSGDEDGYDDDDSVQTAVHNEASASTSRKSFG